MKNSHDNSRLSTMFMACLIFSIGCHSTSNWTMVTYKAAIKSGRTLLKPAMEMEREFPMSEHMIIMYGSTGSGVHEWQTVTFLEGRYELTMVADVELSKDGRSITSVIKQPVFHLLVIDKLRGNRGASYDSRRQQEFGVTTWNAFRESNYNMQVLDSEYDGSAIEGFESFAQEVQQNRKVWR